MKKKILLILLFIILFFGFKFKSNAMYYGKNLLGTSQDVSLILGKNANCQEVIFGDYIEGVGGNGVVVTSSLNGSGNVYCSYNLRSLEGLENETLTFSYAVDATHNSNNFNNVVELYLCNSSGNCDNLTWNALPSGFTFNAPNSSSDKKILKANFLINNSNSVSRSGDYVKFLHFQLERGDTKTSYEYPILDNYVPDYVSSTPSGYTPDNFNSIVMRYSEGHYGIQDYDTLSPNISLGSSQQVLKTRCGEDRYKDIYWKINGNFLPGYEYTINLMFDGLYMFPGYIDHLQVNFKTGADYNKAQYKFLDSKLSWLDQSSNMNVYLLTFTFVPTEPFNISILALFLESEYNDPSLNNELSFAPSGTAACTSGQRGPSRMHFRSASLYRKMYIEQVQYEQLDEVKGIKGFLQGIFNFFTHLPQILTNIITSTFQFIFQPIVDAFRWCFLPSDDFPLTYFETVRNSFEPKLGVLYTPFSILEQFSTRVSSINDTNQYIIHIPNIKDPVYHYTLIEEQNFDLGYVFNYGTFSQIHNLYLLIVDGLIIFKLLSMCYEKFKQIVGGLS